jgi:small conductance mechanosensitive channel
MNRIFVVFMLLSLMGFVTPAQATNGNAPADSILTQIAIFQTEIAELKTHLPGLVGEDSLIIDHELEYAQLKALEQIFLLVDYLAAHKEDHPIRPVEQDLLTRVPNSLTQAEASVAGELKKMRVQRKQIPAQQMGEFEENVADLMSQTTKIQNLIFDYIKAMEKLDQPDVSLSQHLQGEVQGRTRILIGRLRIALEKEASLKRRTPLPASGDDAIVLRAADLRVQANVTNLRELIALMKKLGLNTTSHEAFLIESTGQLNTTDLASGALMRFLNNWFQKMIGFLHKNGLNILIKILMVVGLLILFNYLGKLASKLVITSIDASRFRPSRLLRNMIENMSNRLVMLVGILIALSQIGISLGPMLAGLGVVGFIVGFALQDTLANFASGIMILFYRPFDVGDMVESGTVFGKVKHMSLVSTTILTIDNQTLVVPNNMIWGDVIKNVTAQNLRRVDLIFGVSYSEEIPKVEKILSEILEANEMVLKNPPPQIKLHELADSSVNFVVRPWVRTDDYWDVHWDVTREVKMRFDAEGVTIPFPQRDVHMFEDKAEG